MRRRFPSSTALFISISMFFISTVSLADQDIPNFRQYSPTFASSGQPTATQLQTLKSRGFERIIYIAFSDHEHSLAGEDRLVKSLGMDYLQIPVVWNAPTATDFQLVANALQQAPQQKRLLHCQVNFRASAFAMLYRVIYEAVPLAEAKQDMNSVWTPTPEWTTFILDTLAAHGVDSDCPGCDWTPKEL